MPADNSVQFTLFSGACRALREALRPILSSDDGADSEASSDTDLGRMQRLPGQSVIQAAASLASDMAVQVSPHLFYQIIRSHTLRCTEEASRKPTRVWTHACTMLT